MLRCPSCNTENPPGVDLCKSCGARLPGTETSSDSSRPDPQQGAGPPEPPLDSLEGQVLSQLWAGQKIGAVKLYREQTGVGLKEAKDAVEELARRHGVAPGRGGCAGVLLVLLLVGGAMLAMAV